ncbi:hypothetical protein H7R52_05785 [Weissella confusa]|uniref:Uncharacterized protein n=1 Tax=Weissella confusa TaxID=1583 RepID=A0A923SMU9_WEICO|nr:hypothetical protein [Weissella confusa]
MDTKLYNEDDLFDVDFSMTKAERLEFGDSLMTHAMVLTGRDANISPKDFYAKYIGWDLSEYVSIINAPTADKPFNQTYGVKMLGSVVGGREVKHLNLDLSTFKDLYRLYNAKLRKDAITLRRMVTEHATEEQIAQQVAQFGRENYHILSLTFGEPPVTFNFSYRDKDNNFH